MSTENGSSVSRGIRRLLHTIRERVRRSSQDERGKDDKPIEVSEPPPLPFLPAQRPRPLTPTASLECLVALGTFANLPPELRRRVLVAAFGERTLHLDLRLAHPRLSQNLRPAIPVETAKHEHCRGAAPLSWYYCPDQTAPKTWRWWSCVCHRLVPPGHKFERLSLARGVAPYRCPHHDSCIRGYALCCHMWSPNDKCTVGVMGWLLACRQAYAEDIEVLYSTNTFFIESPALFDTLFCPGPRTHHLLLPQRLASITSLELRWEVLLFGRLPAHHADEDRAQLAAHLRHLDDPFPNLRTLILSFSDHLYNDSRVRPAHALDHIDRVLLQPLADAISRLPPRVQQRHVVVELPSNVFCDLCIAGVQGLGLEVEQRRPAWGDGKSVWLRYPISAPRCPRGDADERKQQDESGSLFYYLKEGVESDLYWNSDGKAWRLSSMYITADRNGAFS
ncbi:hypothetical protein VTK56DRAFT_9814 [Thermocarpiscus australiensis]